MATCPEQKYASTALSHRAPGQQLTLAESAAAGTATVDGTLGTLLAPGAGGSVLTFQAGKATRVWMEAGRHYTLRRFIGADDPTAVEVPDNVVATRVGNHLHLRYADGSTVDFENFYSVCTHGAICSVNLASDSEAGLTLSADTVPGAGVSGDGGTLVYAHGQHDVLMAMAQGQTPMASTFTALGDAPVLTYLPQASHTAALTTEGIGSGALIGGAGLGLAMGGGGGGGTAAAATGSTLANGIVQGSIQAGPVTAGNDLEVTLYAADGITLLKAHVAVDSSGHFSSNVGSYTGVVYARLVNNGAATDYLDEATGTYKDLSAPLVAMGVLSAPGLTLNLNLNALTTIAANKIGANPSAASVEAVNAAVAHAFGLSNLQDTTVAPTNGAHYNPADGLSEGEKYGAVLAGLSGMDKLNGGSMQTTIDQITSQISVSGSTATLTNAIKYDITAGAKVVATVPINQPVVTSQFGDSVATLIQYEADPVTQGLGLNTIGNLAGTPAAPAPTLFDYANANVTGVDTANKLGLINDVIKTLSPTDVNSVPAVQTLSDAVTAVIDGAAGGTPPSLTQLTDLGIQGVNGSNLAALQTAIANTTDDGSAVNTQAKLQALVDTLVNHALGVISAYAEANSASAPTPPTGTAPSLGTYSDAGVSGVDSSNLTAINDALTTAAIQGQQADTPAEVQAIVDAYRSILAEANGATPDATPGVNPTAAQYAAIGANIGAAASAVENLALLNDIVGAQSSTGVDSVQEINDLARIANNVANQAAGIGGLTMAELGAIGITGVGNLSPGNLQNVLNALSATPNDGSGVNTLARIQALVDGAVDLVAPATPLAVPSGYIDDYGSIQNPNSSAASTDDTTPGIHIGSLPPGATGALLYVDGAPVPATYDPNTGTLTPTNVLSEGPHSISYRLTDAAGNQSGLSPALSVRVDTTAPAAPLAAPSGYIDDYGSIQNPNSTAASTDDTTPVIRIGSLPPGATGAVLWVDNAPVPATYDPATGTLTPTNALSEGPHTIGYRLTDDTGNVSGLSPVFSLTVDTTAPDTPLAAPANYADDQGSIQSTTSTAASTDDTRPGITIGGLPAGATGAFLYVGSTKVPATYDPFTGTLTPDQPLADGPHNIGYSLTDDAGNESQPSPTITITVDTARPATPLAAPADYIDDYGSIQNPNSTAASTDDSTPGIHIGSLPPGSTGAFLYVDGNKVDALYNPATGTLTPRVALGEGDHHLSYSLSNAAGNESLQSPLLSLTVDTTPPATPATAPTNYADDVGSITHLHSSATSTDDTTPGLYIGSLPPGASGAYLYVNGTKVAADYDAGSGTLTPQVALTDGTRNLSYSLTDAAGNESGRSTELGLVVDATAPTPPSFNAVATDEHISAAEQGAAVSGSAEANAVVSLTLGTGNVHQVTADGAGHWSYTLQPADISAMGQGPVTLSATATDAVGNTSAAGTHSITVDTVAPTISVNSLAGDGVLDGPEFAALTATPLAISGSTSGVEDGQTVSITLNNNLYTTTVTSNAWTLNLPLADAQALNHGNTYTATASVTDLAGNVSNLGSASVLINIATPDAPTVHRLLSSDTRPTLSGHAEKTLDMGSSFLKLADGDQISVTVNGSSYDLTLGAVSTPAGLSYDTGTGDWTLDLSAATALADGDYEVAVSVVSGGGTRTDISHNELRINTAPVVLSIASITGDDTVNAAEKGGSILIHGSATNMEAGRTIDLTLVDGSHATATVLADGSWSTTVSGSHFNAEGAQQITLNASNAAGTSATPLSHNLSVDTQAPTATATLTLAPGALTAGQSATLTITFSEAVSGFDNNDLTVSNGTLSAVSSNDGGLTWTATFTPNANLVASSNTISLNQAGVSDAAGNAGSGTASSPNFAIDTHHSGASITLSDNALIAGETATVTITFSEAVTGFDNSDLSVSNGTLSAVTSGDGGTTWTASFTPNADFTAASNRITLDNSGVVNAAGNAGVGQTTSVNYRIDTHVPVVATVTDNITATVTKDAITFTVGFDEAIAGLVGVGNFSASNGTIASVTAISSSQYTVVVTPHAGVASGNVALSLIATGLSDSAGNPLVNADLSARDSQGIDTLAPAMPVINPVALDNAVSLAEANAGFAISGTGEAGSTLTLSFASGRTLDGGNSVVVGADGSWSRLVSSADIAAFGQGAEQISATLTDTLGNTSAPGSQTIHVDTLAPTNGATSVVFSVDNGSSPTDLITNVALQTISGSLSAPMAASETVYVSLDNGSSWTAASTTPGATTWSLAGRTLTGSNTLLVKVTDLAGNDGSVISRAYVLDTTAPAQPTPAPSSYLDNVGSLTSNTSSAAITDDTSPGLNIGDHLSDTPSLYVDGHKVDASYDPNTGTLTPTVDLGNGPHTLSYTLTDVAGNESARSADLSLTVDNTAPAQPASAPTSYTDTTGTITSLTSSAPSTDETQPGFNIGALPAGATGAFLYVDGNKVAASYNAGTGTLTPNAALTEAQHSIRYSFVDAAGNESLLSPALLLTIDQTPPTQPAPPSSYADSTGSIVGNASSAPVTDETHPGLNVGIGRTDTPSLYVDGNKVDATYNPITGTLTPTAPLTSAGHALSYTLTDAAGNESARSGDLSLTVDNTPPTQPTAPTSYADGTGSITSASSSAPVTDETHPGLNVGIGRTDSPSLYVDGTKVAASYNPVTGTLTPNTALSGTGHTLSYTLTDAAGNESPRSQPLSLSVDTTPPAQPATPTSYVDDVVAVTSNTSSAASTNDTTPGLNIGIGLSDTPSLYVDGHKVDAHYDSGTGTLTPVTALGSGPHTLSYTLTDAAGNESPRSGDLSLVVDFTPPSQPATAPSTYLDDAGTITSQTSSAASTDDNTPGFNIGNLPVGVTGVFLYVDNTKVPASYNAGTGTLTPDTALTEAQHSIRYSYVDAAGNESGQSPALSLSIDRTPPDTPAAPTHYIDDIGSITNASSSAASTDDTQPGILIGSLPPGASGAFLYVGGNKVDATYDPFTGTLTPNQVLGAGPHDISYSLVDAAGNESQQSPVIAITIDTTPPATPGAPTTYADGTGAITSPTSSAAVTDETRPGLNIGLHLTDTPSLYVDGTKVAATYDPDTGTLTPRDPLSSGTSHTLSYSLTDAAGNESARSPDLNLGIDTTPPAPPASAQQLPGQCGFHSQ